VTYRAALLTAPRHLEVRDLEDPVLGAGEVLVRVRSTNLCPTDVKKWQDESLGALLRDRPLLLGHEIAGEVVATGSGVELRPGARVAINPVLPCGSCEACADARPAACERLTAIGAAAGPVEANARLLAERGIGGGFAEIVKAPRSALFALPDDVSFAAASLLEPLADVLCGIAAGGTVEGRRCVVYGLGPMGLLHVQALAYLGAHVTGVDPREDRRDGALAFGADDAVDPDAAPVADRAYVVVGGAGLVPAATAALEHLEVHGSVVLFASGPSGAVVPVDANRLHYRRQRLVGVVGFETEHAQQALQLLAASAIDVDGLRTPRLRDLDDLQGAFEAIGRPGVLKPAIDFP
jgi:L-iditol 2-dehydrogenase